VGLRSTIDRPPRWRGPASLAAQNDNLVHVGHWRWITGRGCALAAQGGSPVRRAGNRCDPGGQVGVPTCRIGRSGQLPPPKSGIHGEIAAARWSVAPGDPEKPVVVRFAPPCSTNFLELGPQGVRQLGQLRASSEDPDGTGGRATRPVSR